MMFFHLLGLSVMSVITSLYPFSLTVNLICPECSRSRSSARHVPANSEYISNSLTRSTTSATFSKSRQSIVGILRIMALIRVQLAFAKSSRNLPLARWLDLELGSPLAFLCAATAFFKTPIREDLFFPSPAHCSQVALAVLMPM